MMMYVILTRISVISAFFLVSSAVVVIVLLHSTPTVSNHCIYILLFKQNPDIEAKKAENLLSHLAVISSYFRCNTVLLGL
jgi:hypothetical protein